MGRPRKYKINHDYFNQIDSADKAYWLGFIYADGNVQIAKKTVKGKQYSQYMLTIILAEIEPLEKFLVSTESNYQIKPISKTVNGKTYQQYKMVVTSKKMVTDLMSHGCVPAKTHVIRYPTINSKFDRDFIRGYFDGDGSIYAGKMCRKYGNKLHTYTRPCITITTNQAFAKDLRSKISFISQDKGINVDRRKTDSCNLRSWGFDKAKQWFEFLYKDANVYLSRKRDKFISIIEGGSTTVITDLSSTTAD